MCSTCNFKNAIVRIVRGSVELEIKLINGNETNLSLIKKDDKCYLEVSNDAETNRFVTYRCPTCGSKLY